MAEDYRERLPYLARTLSKALSARLERALRPWDLTHAQLAALAQLGLRPDEGRSAADLAKGAAITPQSMSAAVASLLARGLVGRTPHPTHGRVLEVRITSSGLELLAHAQEATEAVERTALAQLDPLEADALKTLLQRVLVTLGHEAWYPVGLVPEPDIRSADR